MEVWRLARRYLQAADSRVEDCVVYATKVQEGDPFGTVEVTVLPTHRGVPFTWPAVAILKLDPLSGRLLVFSSGRLFDAPTSVTPQFGLNEARSRAIEELERFHGTAVLKEMEPLMLTIALPVPKTRGLEEWFSPSRIALGASNRGILIYEAVYGDCLGFDASGEPMNRYQVWIDASSGRALALRHMVPFGGGGTAAKPSPFAWNLGPAPILLNCGPWSTTVNGSVDLVPPPPSFHADRKLGLTVGRLSVRAEYDAKHGLLRTRVGKGYRYGRPSEEVVRSLASRTIH